jgi:hypothetical protein
MTAIPAEVVAAHRLVNQYHVIVRIGAGGYRGSFATLVFGDNKPLIGACHDRRVDLIYLHRPANTNGESSFIPIAYGIFPPTTFFHS